MNTYPDPKRKIKELSPLQPAPLYQSVLMVVGMFIVYFLMGLVW